MRNNDDDDFKKPCLFHADIQLLSPYAGRTLTDLKLSNESGTLTREAINNLFRGLRALHFAKVFHHDIKGDNVLVTSGPEGRARFIDFGVSLDPSRIVRLGGRM